MRGDTSSPFSSMRILMFGWEFPPFNSGGLGVACLGLTRALAAKGVGVTFVMPKKLPITSEHVRMVFADETITVGGHEIHTISVGSDITPYTSRSWVSGSVYRLPDGTIIAPNDAYARDLVSQVARYALAAGAIAAREPHDVIYAHDWLSFGAGIEAKRISGKPLIAHVHATEVDRCGSISSVNPTVYALERAGMHTADRVVAVSELTKQIIVSHYGVDPSKISVVYNGIDETTMPGYRSGMGRLQDLKDAGYTIVLFLGRITLQKGPDYFLRAAARALAHEPKIMFVVSGSGDMERRMIEMSAELGIAQNVLFTGFLQGDDRAIAYTAADLFVMPSVSEPFGITPLEAMKLGTPVLISKQSGVSEIVFNALKTDFWDVDDMADKILAVAHHTALRSTLQQNAQHEVSDITWNKAADRVDTIVHELIPHGVQ